MTGLVNSNITRNIVLIAAITLCAYAITALATPVDAIADATGVAVNDIDSVTLDTVNVDDATAVTAKAVATNGDGKGGVDAINLDDEELLQAALAVDSTKTVASAQKLDLVRREHEYKRQTRAAIIMMIFIAVAMATSQSWNPR